MNVVVIPARGGSKRLPRKNINLFCGKPMIAWSVEAAIASGIFEHIIVSTDDFEIAEVAKQHGAQVPFIRPANLADDFTSTTAVMAHAIQWLLNQSYNISGACCLYATAPLVQVEDIEKGRKILSSDNWDYVFSATEINPQIFRSFTLNRQQEVEMVFPEHFSTRTQDLPIPMQDAAQFYWGKPSAWIKQKRIFDKHSTCIQIPSWRVQDIDNQDDWIKAEMIFNQIKAKNE